MKFSAVVIWYNPESSFGENVKSYATAVDDVIVIDNSESDNSALLRDVPNLHYVPLGQNIGIAAALNRGFEKARTLGAEWVLSMDQDSRFDEADIARLLDSAKGIEADVAVIGHLDRGTPQDGFAEVNRVITSGSLNRLEAYQKIGGFNDALFIDQVDFDFCYRLKIAGFRILKNRRIQMHHKMGNAEVKEFRQRRYTTYNYNPTRRYFQVRNRLYIRKTYPQFKDQRHIKNILRAARYVLLFEDDKLAKLAAMAQGAWHYAIGRYGKR